MNELVTTQVENKFTLNFIENMRDHSERYLRNRFILL